MKKLEFLTELEASIDRAAEEALAGSGRSARDCPYIEYWFDFYRGQDSSHIERAIAKYAPQSAEATRATELIELITDRARSAVEVWANTGRVTGVPPGAPLLPPGREGEVPREGPAQMVLSKARPGGARQPDDPGVLLAQLGSGDSLHPAVKGRMEGAFGQDLSAVRVHTGSNAARLSDDLNARAFTVGKHIAFGGGEYHPGTPAGDGLIAHELAHVIQQEHAEGPAVAVSEPAASYGALEQDADTSAAVAVVSLWDRGGAILGGIGRNAMPQLRGGLRLSRCNGSDSGGCVTGDLTAKTSGPFQGGWDANSYLGAGVSWGNVNSPGTAGRDRTGFKVQMVAPFSGAQNLGVSQTMQFIGANQSMLDHIDDYFGTPHGTSKNGDIKGEPVLDSGDPFAARPWFLRYKDGMASFADVPRMIPGDKGSIDFVTCFHSKGTSCSHKKCCVTWRWSIDLTAGVDTNTVAQQSQQCS